MNWNLFAIPFICRFFFITLVALQTIYKTQVQDTDEIVNIFISLKHFNFTFHICKYIIPIYLTYLHQLGVQILIEIK